MKCIICGNPTKRHWNVTCSRDCSIKNYRSKNRERLAKDARDRYRQDPAKKQAQVDAWRAENPDKLRAQDKKYFPIRQKKPWKLEAKQAVMLAYRGGTLKKEPCPICGNPKTEAHHHSYLKEDYLNIQFLCSRHHKAWHRVFKAIEPTGSE